mgnify:FL=1
MNPIIAVLGEDTVSLKSDFIYEFMGRGFVYTYQTVGEGTATVEVSNDKSNWITLAVFTDADSAVLAHTWAYQRLVPTTLTITVRRD